MRLDKFLKVTRLIKRRTIANALCDCGGVVLDNKIAKASTEVKTGQKITLLFGNRTITATVIGVPSATQKIMAIDAMIADVVTTPVPRNTPQAQHPSDDE
ncbi:MAG: RNA-binding S4 domain-containing protein [Vampirovibrionales bacterium]|nr:RNA-binding S4 domain-containing protein [Vampirovibrionales bacterium]